MKVEVLKSGKIVPKDPPPKRTFWQKVKDFFSGYESSGTYDDIDGFGVDWGLDDDGDWD
jgi:hypothetical protein